MKMLTANSRTYLLVLFCLFANVAIGQSKLENLKNDNQELEKSIKRTSITIEGTVNKIHQLNGEIQQYTATIRELDDSIQRIKKQSSKEVIDSLTFIKDSLDRSNKALDENLKKIAKEISEYEKKLSKLNTDIGDMSKFAEVQRARNLESNIQYLKQRYSTIDAGKLNAMLDGVEEFASEDKYLDYKKRLVHAIANKKLYDEGFKAISSEFNSDTIWSIREKLIIQLEVETDNPDAGIYKMSPEQFGEMDTIDIRLSRFKGGLNELAKIFKLINSDEQIVEEREKQDALSKENILTKVRTFIYPNEGAETYNVYKRYFTMIPYLENTLKAYIKELEKDPYKYPTSIEEIIKNQIVE